MQADYQMTPKATSAEALEAETKTGINLDITKMTDPQANHYEATTDINVKIMEALGVNGINKQQVYSWRYDPRELGAAQANAPDPRKKDMKRGRAQDE